MVNGINYLLEGAVGRIRSSLNSSLSLSSVASAVEEDHRERESIWASKGAVTFIVKREETGYKSIRNLQITKRRKNGGSWGEGIPSFDFDMTYSTVLILLVVSHQIILYFLHWVSFLQRNCGTVLIGTIKVGRKGAFAVINWTLSIDDDSSRFWRRPDRNETPLSHRTGQVMVIDNASWFLEAFTFTARNTKLFWLYLKVKKRKKSQSSKTLR